MKVILTANIKKLGKIGDSVNVKNGFARNFLFPQKKALRENKKNLEYFENLRKEIEKKENEVRDKAENMLKKLDNINIEFLKEADEKDQLYGSVTVKEIQNYLNNKEIEINADDIQINVPIKSIGEHKIVLNPYDDLIKTVRIFVKKSNQNS